MKLLELNNHTIEINPYTLTVKEFERIWDKDKSKNKETAIKELSYVYYFSDYTSVYRNYPEKEREQRIIEDIFDKTWKPSKDLKEACDKYRELNTSRSMKFLFAAEEAGEKLISYFKTIDLSKTDKSGKPMYSAKDLISNLKQVGDVIQGIKKLKEEVEKEQEEGSIIRGGDSIGEFEDPDEDY